VRWYRERMPGTLLDTPAALLAIAVALVLSGCAAGPAGPAAPGGPPPGATIDYQLGGGYDPAAGVRGVVRDSTDSPAPGLYSICYVNGFQTQPSESADWLSLRSHLVLMADGEPVVDPDWPDELILDTATAADRAAIAEAVTPTLRRCADAGFDAVEIDNLDSYTRSGDALTADGAIALATLYAATAHDLGLTIAQKNAAELSGRARHEAGFDFAVAEECHRFDECESYTDVYGDAVVDIEYTDDLRGTFADVCADPRVPASTILRDRELAPASDPAHVFESC
jgi:hypothetical protein